MSEDKKETPEEYVDYRINGGNIRFLICDIFKILSGYDFNICDKTVNKNYTIKIPKEYYDDFEDLIESFMGVYERMCEWREKRNEVPIAIREIISSIYGGRELKSWNIKKSEGGCVKFVTVVDGATVIIERIPAVSSEESKDSETRKLTTKERRDKTIKLKKMGLTQRRIADILGVNQSLVSKDLRITEQKEKQESTMMTAKNIEEFKKQMNEDDGAA